MRQFVAGFRVMVSGSRTWKDRDIIWRDLDEDLVEATALGLRLILVHGHCPRGADRHADDWGNQVEQARNPPGIVIVERHPPNRALHGRRCFFIRNRTMVESRIDRARFYIHDDSRGATQTLGLARTAALPRMVRKRWGDDWSGPSVLTEVRPIAGLERP